MPISLVGSGVATTTTAAANITINLPAGLAQNDVVDVGVASGATSDADVTEASGTWTEVADLYQNDSTDVNLGVFRKVMGAVPDTSVTLAATAGTNIHVAIVVAGRNVDTTTPADAAAVTGGAIDSGTPNNPAITPVTAGAWVWAWAASSEGDSVPNAPLHYGDLRFQTGTNICIVVSRRLIPAAVAIDPPAYSDIVGTTADSYATVSTAWRPAVAGGPYEPVRTMHAGRLARAA